MASARRLTESRVNYPPRLIGCLLFAALLLAIEGEEHRVSRISVAAACLLWPHVALWAASVQGGGRSVERLNVLFDYVLAGVVIAHFSFRLLPTTAVYAMGFLNAMIFGGPRLAAIGLAIGTSVFAGTGWLMSMRPRMESEPLVAVLSVLTLLGYAAFISYTVYRLRVRQREMRSALEREERQGRELLLNVFPAPIVSRLKLGENPIADQFADVTVVFVDIVEFTPLAERLGPRRTVLLLNELFGRFDQAAARLQVEKIETTGDGYLAVAGAPNPLDDHAKAAADFALAALDAARATPAGNAESVQIRVGLHTGPIYGGVVGDSRFHYKIFGDTVNTASRVQSQATPGRTLVSEATARRLRTSHALSERGIVELKGVGPMRTYWLEGPIKLAGSTWPANQN